MTLSPIAEQLLAEFERAARLKAQADVLLSKNQRQVTQARDAALVQLGTYIGQLEDAAARSRGADSEG
jgi:hypothetical protein